MGILGMARCHRETRIVPSNGHRHQRWRLPVADTASAAFTQRSARSETAARIDPWLADCWPGCFRSQCLRPARTAWRRISGSCLLVKMPCRSYTAPRPPDAAQISTQPIQIGKDSTPPASKRHRRSSRSHRQMKPPVCRVAATFKPVMRAAAIWTSSPKPRVVSRKTTNRTPVARGNHNPACFIQPRSVHTMTVAICF